MLKAQEAALETGEFGGGGFDLFFGSVLCYFVSVCLWGLFFVFVVVFLLVWWVFLFCLCLGIFFKMEL